VARRSISGLGWSEVPPETNKEQATGHPTRTERETATGRLLIAYRDEGDGRARDRLAQLYQPLVEAFASRCAGHGADHDHLVEVGSAALLGAIDRCDPRRGDEFLAFAVPAIADDMRRQLRDAAGSGEVEIDERVLLADVFQALDDTERSIIYLRFVREMPDRETAAQLGMSENRLRRSTRTALAKLGGELERSAFPAAVGARVAAGNGQTTEPETQKTKPSTTRANGSEENGRSASPANKAAYSGRILVRMPQTLHDELARAAESERVSLNQFITNALSAAIGWQLPPHLERRSPRWLTAAVVMNIVVVVLAGIAALILLLVALDQGL
jgi:RNA polymerase sigma factor (sigma-70 family)